MFILAIFTASFSHAQQYYMFVGTYTQSGSKGIYVYNFDAATGKLTWVSNTDSVVNPSYLTVAPNGRYVYSVTETGSAHPGGVTAFTFDAARGRLSFINRQTSGGDNPCYITITKDNKWVFVGNYTGGSLAAFPVNGDGSLQPFAQLIQHEGKSVNTARQEKAHVHSTILSPDQRYLLTPDLGMDQVSVYRFLPQSAKPLQEARPAFAAAAPGSGPRHLAFHPNNRYAYVIEELSGTVAAYKYSDGKLSFLQRLSSHPAGYKGSIGSADIHIAPDGKFLYASNRGDANTITVFSVTPTGKLEWRGYHSTKGVKPRNFIIDPTGRYLVVANQDSNNIVVFKRNAKTGLLEDTGTEVTVPSPVCLQMLKKGDR